MTWITHSLSRKEERESRKNNRDNWRDYSGRGANIASLKDSYKELGLESTATFKEVKSTYRKLAMELHPDKVNQLKPELIKVSEEKFKKINNAYEAIKKQQGNDNIKCN